MPLKEKNPNLQTRREFLKKTTVGYSMFFLGFSGIVKMVETNDRLLIEESAAKIALRQEQKPDTPVFTIFSLEKHQKSELLKTNLLGILSIPIAIKGFLILDKNPGPENPPGS